MKGNIRKSILIPIYDYREDNKRLIYLPMIMAELTSDEDSIITHQFNRLKDIIYYAYENVPFYKKLYDRNGCIIKNAIKSIDDIEKLPIITKEDIRSNNNDLLSKEIDPENLILTSTGGTTDSPIRLKYTKDCFSQKQACTLFFYQWFNYELGDKIAYIWGAEQDFSEQVTVRQKIKNYLFQNKMILPSSYLNDDIMFDYYIKLHGFNPTVLQSYPTPLYIFSCFLERHDLKLHIPNINVTAENLYDFQREKIEEVFRCKIFNWYGARELGHAATECFMHHGMHMNTYGLFFEVIKDGRRVYDEMGEIVVTDLLNRAMPLIRYKIGDIGIISSRKCSCGSSLPLLEEVGGRLVDSFRKRDGTYIPGIAFTNRVIKEYKEIKELQIIQKDYEIFELNIVKGPEYSDSSLERLKRTINSFMHSELQYTSYFKERLEVEKSGKIRLCKCEMQ